MENLRFLAAVNRDEPETVIDLHTCVGDRVVTTTALDGTDFIELLVAMLPLLDAEFLERIEFLAQEEIQHRT